MNVRIPGLTLLVHGERDEVYPVTDCQSLAAALATNGVEVETRILPGLPHDFGEEAGVVMRGVAEHCAAHLSPADYTAALPHCRLTAAEQERAIGTSGVPERGGRGGPWLGLVPKVVAGFLGLGWRGWGL